MLGLKRYLDNWDGVGSASGLRDALTVAPLRSHWSIHKLLGHVTQSCALIGRALFLINTNKTSLHFGTNYKINQVKTTLWNNA